MGLEFDHPQGAKLGDEAALSRTASGRFSRRSTRACCSSSRASCSAQRWCDEMLDASTAVASAREAVVVQAAEERVTDAISNGRHGPTAGGAARAPELMLERARWAADRVRDLRPRAHQRDRRARRRGGIPKRRKVREWAVRGDRAWASPSTSGSRTRRARAGSPSTTRRRLRRTPRSTPRAKIVEVPRPAGVMLALTPSTNPIATVYFKVLLALMTRNAIVVSPHPLARECSVDAARHLARPRSQAGAPDGCHAGRRGADDPADRGADGRPGEST